MVYVTHDQIEAMTMADRIVVLNGGRVEQFGTPMELYHHPATKFVASFIGQPNMNLIPAVVKGTNGGLSVELDGGHHMTLPVDAASVRTGDAVEVGIRPEDVTLGGDMSVHIRVLERLGGATVTYGSIGQGTRCCAALPGNAAVRQGETMGLAVDPSACHVFDANGDVLRRMSAPELVA